MFDALVREVSQRFGLGDKAQMFVTSLLALIFDPNNGGIDGLLDKFKQQGLSDLFSSWLGGTPGLAPPINQQQLESVLGSTALSAIADRLGVARGTIVAASCAALPKLIGLLTPGRQLPITIPASVASLIGAAGGTAIHAASDPTAASPSAIDGTGTAGNSLGWLKWLILAAIILALSYCMLNRNQPAPTSPPATNPPPAAAPSTAQTAIDDAKAAIGALVPGKYTADDLVKALNLMSIHFAAGATTIDADSFDVLSAAANAIKAAPPDSKVEIGGHTDNTGDTAANLKLSEDRANAVRSKLVELGVAPDMLTAKGYGDTKPIADNVSEEGRAKNRRMEFMVLH
jgi:outer membrane protein OmpA-like peptidoglycan-associated protein/uncharacterized protein YidB (DUF937 family)